MASNETVRKAFFNRISPGVSDDVAVGYRLATRESGADDEPEEMTAYGATLIRNPRSGKALSYDDFVSPYAYAKASINRVK